jgi:RNA polymerase sigma-70 factor (ECF subfamily)
VRGAVKVTEPESILEKAQQKDHTAFAELVEKHKSMVYSIAYHCLHERGVAEELAQDVFLQLYQNINKIQSPNHLVFWLRRTTSHRAIDYIRRQQGKKSVSLEDLPEISVAAKPGDPLLTRLLRQLVASLPEKARAIVTLRYQEDLQPSEIAEMMGMPVNTVKSQLQRTLDLLGDKISSLEKVSA